MSWDVEIEVVFPFGLALVCDSSDSRGFDIGDSGVLLLDTLCVVAVSDYEPTVIRVFDEEPKQDVELIAAGSLLVPSGCLAVQTAEESLVEVDLTQGVTEVALNVYANRGELPDVVWVVLEREIVAGWRSPLKERRGSKMIADGWYVGSPR